MNEYGVDSSNSITLTFEDGATAILHSSMLVLSDRRGMIYGDRGIHRSGKISIIVRASKYMIPIISW